jgi:endogenous inhibitor of DNA gyrase (YacG/DUF329 family)
MTRYTVNGKAEEFDCPHCGTPIYSGDTAWDDNGTAVYCSARCARSAADDAALERKAVTDPSEQPGSVRWLLAQTTGRLEQLVESSDENDEWGRMVRAALRTRILNRN